MKDFFEVSGDCEVVHSKVVSSNRAVVLFIMKRVYRVFGNNLFQIKIQKVNWQCPFVKRLNSKIISLLIIVLGKNLKKTLTKYTLGKFKIDLHTSE
jgi:hypothetical protein